MVNVKDFCYFRRCCIQKNVILLSSYHIWTRKIFRIYLYSNNIREKCMKDLWFIYYRNSVDYFHHFEYFPLNSLIIHFFRQLSYWPMNVSILLSIYLIISHPILSYLILSYLILSYLILSYLILSYLILSYIILSYLILSYLILYYIILS